MILLIGLSNLIVIFIGGQQYMSGEIEIGVLAEFIIYINMLTWPVAVVGWVTSVVQQAEASQKRINAFLNEPIEIKDGSEVDVAIQGEIILENVTLVYPETKIKALDGISLKIESGKSLGIIGKVDPENPPYRISSIVFMILILEKFYWMVMISKTLNWKN